MHHMGIIKHCDLIFFMQHWGNVSLSRDSTLGSQSGQMLLYGKRLRQALAHDERRHVPAGFLIHQIQPWRITHHMFRSLHGFIGGRRVVELFFVSRMNLKKRLHDVIFSMAQSENKI
jgi:hypothetical protein